MYVSDVENKTMDANARPALLKESPATAWVDGNNGLGPVVGDFCMQLAIQKAKTVGVGWVAAKGTLVFYCAAINEVRTFENYFEQSKCPIACNGPREP
jgi:LDH2 family malate/lactate/ureidoglycolate dehydrogenase